MKTILALATSLGLAGSGAALAQAPHTGGADRGHVNKSGAVGGTGSGALESTGSTAAGRAPGTSGSGAAPSGR